MTSRVQGKTAIVIGGASGIGWASARLLAAQGARVIVADINADAAVARSDELGAPSQGHWVDVGDEDSILALVDAATDGGDLALDILVNCAGVNLPGFLTELSSLQWRTVIDLCLTGAFFTIKHGAPAMPRGGAIVTIASLNARQPAAGFGAYCAAKAGVTMLTQVAALELGERGIRVNAISPGLVETSLVSVLTSSSVIQADFTDNTPLGRNGQPDDIAEAVLYLASDASSWVTGQTLDVNGGAHLRRYPDVMKHLAAQ